MKKNKTFLSNLFSLGLAVIFLPGCVYLSHFDETMRMKDLADNQQEMQAQLDRERDSFNKLKADIEKGSLKKLTRRRSVLYRYGEPASCRQSKAQSEIKETCFYRKPGGGLLSEIIELNFNAKDRLCSWQIEDPEK